jgi:hypothetical protein
MRSARRTGEGDGVGAGAGLERGEGEANEAPTSWRRGEGRRGCERRGGRGGTGGGGGHEVSESDCRRVRQERRRGAPVRWPFLLEEKFQNMSLNSSVSHGLTPNSSDLARHEIFRKKGLSSLFSPQPR